MAIDGALRGLTGAFNWTNPGAISHNEVLELYRDYLHPEFLENFTEEEQAEVIKAPRSNNTMCDKKLRAAFPEVLGIKESIIKYVMEPNKGWVSRRHQPADQVSAVGHTESERGVK